MECPWRALIHQIPSDSPSFDPDNAAALTSSAVKTTGADASSAAGAVEPLVDEVASVGCA